MDNPFVKYAMRPDQEWVQVGLGKDRPLRSVGHLWEFEHGARSNLYLEDAYVEATTCARCGDPATTEKRLRGWMGYAEDGHLFLALVHDECLFAWRKTCLERWVAVQQQAQARQAEIASRPLPRPAFFGGPSPAQPQPQAGEIATRDELGVNWEVTRGMAPANPQRASEVPLPDNATTAPAGPGEEEAH